MLALHKRELKAYVRWVQGCAVHQKRDRHPHGVPISFLVTRTGIEPMLQPWKGRVLTAWPTRRMWWLKPDLNQRPAGYEPDALANWAIQPCFYELFKISLDYYITVKMKSQDVFKSFFFFGLFYSYVTKIGLYLCFFDNFSVYFWDFD